MDQGSERFLGINSSRLRHNTSYHWFEVLERKSVVDGIKRLLIPSVTEINAGLVVRVIPEAVSEMPIISSVVEVIVALEQTMVLQYPVVLLIDKRTKYSGNNLAVVVGHQNISYIMQ